MSCWEPHIDLTRLLDALSVEIVVASAYEVRQACLEEGCSIHEAASEVRQLIGNLDGPDPGPFPSEAVERRDHLPRQH